MRMNSASDGVWVFGYGSLIWRPDIPFRERRVAWASGWKRRFWQGSHDHRGLPHAPGRVVTLVPEAGARCGGMAYFVEAAAMRETWDELDYREKNGYRREAVRLEFREGEADGAVYVAPVGNHAFLGPAPFPEMAAQILRSAGPSGTNIDYMRQLAGELRRHGIEDEHVFRLERHVEDLARQAGPGCGADRGKTGGDHVR
ncbi:MAG: gamma-glutamylcyclotransferase [Alphaproteobacteria bacterium]|nr:gamma-glutamylcyclotransferase [Alphaproteobacteria bacterium]